MTKDRPVVGDKIFAIDFPRVRRYYIHEITTSPEGEEYLHLFHVTKDGEIDEECRPYDTYTWEALTSGSVKYEIDHIHRKKRQFRQQLKEIIG